MKIIVDRRVTLAWVSASVAAACSPKRDAQSESSVNKQSTRSRSDQTYGTDPDLNSKPTPWHKIMTQPERATTAALADVILPAEDGYPAPSEIGIQDFIDEWISAPYPVQVSDSELILPGLALLEAQSLKTGGRDFALLPSAQQIGMVRKMASADPKSADYQFFYRFRALVLGAYYTTETGFEDIGYIGNVAMPSFPGPSQDIVARLNSHLENLGL